MPANKRPRRLNYVVNKKGPKTGKKSIKVIGHYKKLMNRIKKEGETKWLINALSFVEKKIKKYSININKI